VFADFHLTYPGQSNARPVASAIQNFASVVRNELGETPKLAVTPPTPHSLRSDGLEPSGPTLGQASIFPLADFEKPPTLQTEPAPVVCQD